jgi:hypothetical protein
MAIQVLLENGFVGRIYNGQGVSQWLTAGYDLVNVSTSVEFPCLTDDEVAKECENVYEAPSPAPAPSGLFNWCGK